MLKHPACGDVFIRPFDRVVQVATVGYEVFQGVLGELIGSAVGLSSEVLQLLFQRGSEVDCHEETIGVPVGESQYCTERPARGSRLKLLFRV